MAIFAPHKLASLEYTPPIIPKIPIMNSVFFLKEKIIESAQMPKKDVS